jgi:response regulator RpfG family c-di-GMP phosphodiesterase
MPNSLKSNGAPKILVVDDKQSPAIMLNSHGYDVESISNVIEAYLFIQKKHPDLVLLELDRENAVNFQLWEQIKLLSPKPSVAFMIKDAIYRPLSCVQEFIGQRGRRRRQGTATRSTTDLIDQVAALFAA